MKNKELYPETQFLLFFNKQSCFFRLVMACRPLICTTFTSLRAVKVLTFENSQINLEFRSLNRTFANKKSVEK